MKSWKTLALVVLVMCTPLAAFADMVTFTNTNGSLVSNSQRTTLTLMSSGSQASLLTAISGLTGLGIADQSVVYSACKSTGCLGTVGFTTGTRIAGFLFSPSATFDAGGSITIVGNGFTFSGSFSAGATWTCTPVPGGPTCNGTPPGGGTWFFNGTVVNGQLTINGKTYIIPNAGTIQISTSGKAPTGGATGPLTWTDAGGTTTFPSPVPEPGSLGLVGSGLIALGMLAKWKPRSKP
jgi:hypothetical protein